MQAAVQRAIGAAPPGAPLPSRRQQPSTVAAASRSAVEAAQHAPPPAEGGLDRRTLLGAAAAVAATAAWQAPALAIQGLVAGRIPGLTGPDDEGNMTYTRPEGKSGGHGVGWSEIQRYSFKVPPTWQEVPVSIADLGGTEIDLRYNSADEGTLQVVVAPVARFKEVGINSNITVEDLAPPENLIAGFAPELFGNPLNEGDVLDMQVVQKGGIPYYIYELTRHRLVTATATGNRLYMLAVRCNSLQWRKSGDKLTKIRDSFSVPPKVDV